MTLPLNPDPREIRRSLHLLHPEGPWALSAKAEQGGFHGEVFDDLAQAANWAAAQNRQGANAYICLGQTRVGWSGAKAKKTDIASVGWLWVDIDPRPGLDLAQERERIEALVTSELPLGVPKPTAVIDSGSGTWVLWQLVEPVSMPLAGDPAWDGARAQIEERNRFLAQTFGADHCHSLDHLCRLPGTVNWPDKKKRARGRVPALARLVYAGSEVYPLSAFGRLAEPASGSFRSSTNSVPPGPIKPVDLASLPITDELRALIRAGADPKDSARWADRSRLVFHVLCKLIRADVADEELLSIILDPQYGISDHVREQPKPVEYAWRQVQRALQHQPRPGPLVVPSALNFARAYRDARRPHLRHHQQEFLDWDGAAYVGVADETIRAEVWKFLETCRKKGKPGENEPEPVVPTSALVNGAIDALKSEIHLPAQEAGSPGMWWLDGRSDPNPKDLLSTRSGLLHLPTKRLLPASPDLFTRNALDFAYDPSAPEPQRWLSFLKEVWPDTEEKDCITALQEFMGYLLTPDTSLQKALLIVGPKRSGKGTIGRVMERLVGPVNTVSPSLTSFGRDAFCLQPLLAKQLALVSDMRQGMLADQGAIAENLLRITGEDRVSVNRKHLSALEVTLKVRFVLMTNEPPKFADKSDALVSRFIALPMRCSFFGKEDPKLAETLAGELPGILNWAVEGWRRVRRNERISQPAIGHEMVEQMKDLSSPIPAFLRDCCEVGGDYWTLKETLFAAFKAWHERHMGKAYQGLLNTFAAQLYSGAGGVVRDTRPRAGEERVSAFAGIRLRPGAGAQEHNDDLPF